MKRTSLLAAVFASTLLGGCATYDYVGNTAPGGYYHGRPTTEYYSPYGYYDGYYGGVGVYSGPYRYRGSYGYPYYGYYGSYYPYYRPHHHPRPPRPGDNDNKPPPTSGGGNRPPPWRDPTGRWREGGSQPLVPNRSSPASPAPSQPRMSGGYQPPRVTPSPSMPRTAERPRTMERPAAPRAERSAPRVERATPRPSAPRESSPVRQLEP